MNILESFEKNQIENLTKNKKFPNFYAGDTLKIHLKIKEGEKERIQIFEGVCIAKKNAGINSSFTVRKISYGEGVERIFPFYSPQISKIELSKSGSVRRSKLYYLRERSGKSARISEKNKFSNQKITNEKIVEKENNDSKSLSNEKKVEINSSSDQKNLEVDKKSDTTSKT